MRSKTEDETSENRHVQTVNVDIKSKTVPSDESKQSSKDFWITNEL